MVNFIKKRDKLTKYILWIARIWSIPIIIYAFMMAVGYSVNWLTTGKADPYTVGEYPFIENLPPIFLFLAILGLCIAWRWLKLGVIINLLFCLFTFPILLIHWPITQDSRFVIPYILLILILFPGILFLIYLLRSGKKKMHQ